MSVSRKLRSKKFEKFPMMALKLAKENLQHSIEWVDKKEITWALVTARNAVKLLEVAGENV